MNEPARILPPFERLQAALAAGMQEKSAEFRAAGSEVYLPE